MGLTPIIENLMRPKPELNEEEYCSPTSPGNSWTPLSDVDVPSQKSYRSQSRVHRTEMDNRPLLNGIIPNLHHTEKMDMPGLYLIMGEPPHCLCHLPAQLYMAFTDDLNDEMVYWKCPREGHLTPCRFLRWADYQPMTDLIAWRFQEDQHGYKRSPKMILEEMICLQCPHKTTNKKGTNAFKERASCTLCGKVLEVKDKPQKAKPPESQHSGNRASSSSGAQEEHGVRAAELAQFQQFLRWQENQQDLQKQKQVRKPSGK